MVINVANMRDVRPKLGDHTSQSPPRIVRIDGMGRETKPSQHPDIFIFKVDRWNEVLVIDGRLAARVRHRKQRYLMSPSSHHIHEVEEIDFGPAEGKVIFVAVQDSHKICFLLVPRSDKENSLQKPSRSSRD